MESLFLDKNEHIIRVLKQSKIVLLKPLVYFALLTFLPWYYLIGYSLGEYYKLGLLVSVVGVLYFLREYRLWSLHKYIFTNARLIKQSHETIYKKVVVETPLDRILNVSYKTTGFLSVLFKFGDVEVQVVGLMEPLILKNIKRPENIKEYLWRSHEKSLAQSNSSGIAHLQETIGYTKSGQRVL